MSFEAFCVEFGIGAPAAEFRFAPPRKWRFDYAWPEQKIALEIEGGIWTGGRHTRASGFLKDVEKYNEAAILGWRILRCQPKEIANGAILLTLQRAMGANHA